MLGGATNGNDSALVFGCCSVIHGKDTNMEFRFLQLTYRLSYVIIQQIKYYMCYWGLLCLVIQVKLVLLGMVKLSVAFLFDFLHFRMMAIMSNHGVVNWSCSFHHPGFKMWMIPGRPLGTIGKRIVLDQRRCIVCWHCLTWSVEIFRSKKKKLAGSTPSGKSAWFLMWIVVGPLRTGPSSMVPASPWKDPALWLLFRRHRRTTYDTTSLLPDSPLIFTGRLSTIRAADSRPNTTPPHSTD